MSNRKIFVLILATLTVLGGLGALYYYQKNNKDRPYWFSARLLDKDRGLTQDQKKIYLDRISMAESYLKGLAPSGPKYSLELLGTYVYLGQQYHGLGKFEESKNAYAKAYAINPLDEQMAVGISMSLSEGGQPAIAKRVLQEAAARNPKNYDLWLRIIEISQFMGEQAAAVEEIYQNALDKTERYADILTKFAQFEEKLGKYQEAKNLWQEAMEKNPESAALYKQEIDRLNPLIKQ